MTNTETVEKLASKVEPLSYASFKQTIRAFQRLLPVLIGVLLLAALVAQLIPKLMQMGLFGHGAWSDTLAAAGVASIATGQPVVSYILAGGGADAGLALCPVAKSGGFRLLPAHSLAHGCTVPCLLKNHDHASCPAVGCFCWGWWHSILP